MRIGLLGNNPVYRVDGVSNIVKVAEVSAADIDDGVAGTAHLFQKRIPKAVDVRVTVIGTRVFCVRIDSDVLDWRTDYDRLRATKRFGFTVRPGIPAGISTSDGLENSSRLAPWQQVAYVTRNSAPTY